MFPLRKIIILLQISNINNINNIILHITITKFIPIYKLFFVIQNVIILNKDLKILKLPF